MRCRLGSMLVAIVLFAASNVRAGSCLPGQRPFTDVPDSASFCAGALWQPNALVTLQIQMNVDGGLFQTFVGNTPRVLIQPNQRTVVPVMGGYTILGGNGVQRVSGSTHPWRILMLRQGGFTSGDVTSNRRQIMINLPVESAT